MRRNGVAFYELLMSARVCTVVRSPRRLGVGRYVVVTGRVTVHCIIMCSAPTLICFIYAFVDAYYEVCSRALLSATKLSLLCSALPVRRKVHNFWLGDIAAEAVSVIILV